MLSYFYLQRVIDVCKTYLPSMACGYSDHRCNLIIGDGADYVKKTKDKFDVIINDCTDSSTSGK